MGKVARTRFRDRYRAEVMIEGQRARKVFATEEEAQRWLEEICQRRNAGITLDKAKITVAQLVALFLADRESRGLKQTTLQAYSYSAGYINRILGDVPVQQLRPDHVDQFLAQTRKLGHSVKYRRNHYNVLHAVLEFGISRDVLDRNVAARVEAPRWNRTPPRAWTSAEVERFKEVIAGERLQAMWWVFLSTGLRVGELAALTWEDLDPATGELTVQRRLVRLKTGWDLDTPKSRAGLRKVTLPPPVSGMLAAWRQKQRLEKIASRDRWEEGGWIFTTWKGNNQGGHKIGHHLEPRWILTRLGQLLKKNGFAHLSVHGLRHSFATLMLQNNVPLRDVQEVLGHSRPSVTLDVYWQAIAGASGRVAGKAGEIFFPEPDTPNEGDSPDLPRARG